MSSNNLTGTLPATIGNIAPLTDLWLNGNAFSGELPSTVTNLANLRVLCVLNAGVGP